MCLTSSVQVKLCKMPHIGVQFRGALFSEAFNRRLVGHGVWNCNLVRHQYFPKLNTSLYRRVATWSPLASAFNNKQQKVKVFDLLERKTGLFGMQELQDPHGFYLLKERAILDTQQLVTEALSPSRSRKMVQIFDELSDTLCKVADLAEFVRIGHPQKRFSTSAEEAAVAVSGLVEKLNVNRELYDALKKVVDHGDIVQTDAVDQLVGSLFLFDFEQSGIHLDEAKRERVLALNEYILHLGSHFMNGSLKPRTVLKSQLPENIRHCFALDGDRVILPGLFSDSDSELVREAAYRIFLHPDSHQNGLLDELLEARYELAQLCGFETYAHRATRGSIAGDPDMVNEFLKILSDELRPRAQKDYDTMLEMKRSRHRYAKNLMPWDVPYYTSVLKQEKYSVKNCELCPYFSLGTCMDGLNLLFQALYGLTLEVQETAPGEVWNFDVVKLAVKEGSEVLGYIYCDFFERPEKPSQDCHYTIRGGKLMEDGTYQLPVVVLMLNFPSPTMTMPTLLTPGMLDNLFHEMGHAMHSMLARTPYQHVTGTRCATDLAEVPSILMEYFATDPRVLSMFARHYQTGRPIPQNLVHTLSASKHTFAASETQLQVFYAALDQSYHGPNPLAKTTTARLAEIQEEYYGLPYIPNTAWQLRFGHLVGYGAKYYSYLMSRAVASSIWKYLFKGDPFNRAAGERYRREVLAHGGGKPPRKLVEDVLRTSVTPTFLAQTLVEEMDEKKDK